MVCDHRLLVQFVSRCCSCEQQQPLPHFVQAIKEIRPSPLSFCLDRYSHTSNFQSYIFFFGDEEICARVYPPNLEAMHIYSYMSITYQNLFSLDSRLRNCRSKCRRCIKRPGPSFHLRRTRSAYCGRIQIIRRMRSITGDVIIVGIDGLTDYS